MRLATLEPTTFSTDTPLAIQISEIVRTRGSLVLRVQGGSMAPSIRPGDILFIVRAELAQVAPGRVALFMREGRLFVHRVIGKQGAGSEQLLITKGDTLVDRDAPISNADLLGRVERIYRGSREIDLTNPSQIALGKIFSLLSLSKCLSALARARRLARSFARVFR